MDIKWLAQNTYSLTKKTLRDWGDIFRLALPIASFFLALFLKSDILALKCAISIGIVVVLTSALKFLFNFTKLGRRPNGGSDSMPSGHTSSAFQGASFILFGVNFWIGIPAMLFACLTGYSRVWAGVHWWRDVIVGAFLGMLVSFLCIIW